MGKIRWLPRTPCKKNHTTAIYLSLAKNSSRLPIIFPPPSSILNNHPFPLHYPPRHPRIRLIGNTPTPPPLQILGLYIPLTRPRWPLHVSIRRHHNLRTPPGLWLQSHPLPFPFNIDLLPTPTPPATPLRIRNTNTHLTCPRTGPPLLHLHQLNPRGRGRRRSSYGSWRRRGADNGRAGPRRLYVLCRTRRGALADNGFGHDSTATFARAVREHDVFLPCWSSCWKLAFALHAACCNKIHVLLKRHIAASAVVCFTKDSSTRVPSFLSHVQNSSVFQSSQNKSQSTGEQTKTTRYTNTAETGV